MLFTYALRLTTWLAARRVAALDKAAARKFDTAYKLRQAAARLLAESEAVHTEGQARLNDAVTTESRLDALKEV